MKLRKEIQYYNTGEIYNIELVDEKGYRQGEYIRYHEDGNIYEKGFLKDGRVIGKYYREENFYYFGSFINLGQYISEQEHKKELVMIRLGLIEAPELSYFLKDYDENGKIK